MTNKIKTIVTRIKQMDQYIMSLDNQGVFKGKRIIMYPIASLGIIIPAFGIYGVVKGIISIIKLVGGLFI